MPESLRSTLTYLQELGANNNKAWFDKNRIQYDKARGAFEEFITDLILNFEPVEDLTGVTAKECMFRINRDIRFSPDKTPYKTSMSAVIGKGGRKFVGRSYYVHIQPGGQSIIAGGLYSPSSAELEKVRRQLAEDSRPYKKIVQGKSFVDYFGSVSGEKLKTAPQGYPKDHPDIDLLRHKQFVVEHGFSDEQVLRPDLSVQIVKMCSALKPFVGYFVSALEV
jgi:uncharacterized protein (TIGR02453 family)